MRLVHGQLATSINLAGDVYSRVGSGTVSSRISFQSYFSNLPQLDTVFLKQTLRAYCLNVAGLRHMVCGHQNTFSQMLLFKFFFGP